jgi:adenylate kinase
MKVYMEPLDEIQKFYNDKKLLKIISGEGTIEEIVTNMETFIKEQI